MIPALAGQDKRHGQPLRGWGHGRDVTRRLHLRLLTVGPYRGHRADGDAAIITYPLQQTQQIRPSGPPCQES